MKTKIFLILSLVMTLGIVGCTSDFDENNNSQEEKLKSVKNRVKNIASEYGLKSFSITDEALLKNLNITDEEIESRIQMALEIQGTYVLKTKGEKRFGVVAKVGRKSPRRSPSDYDWEEEHHSGSFSNNGWKDNYGFSMDFDYEYGHDISNSLNCGFDVDEDFRKKKKDENGNETEVWIVSVRDIGSPDPMFNGDEDHLTISYSYMIEITYSDGTTEIVTITGVYTEEDGNGTATLSVL